MSTLTNEMKSHLAQYVNRQCSLEEFEDWFAPVLRDVHKTNDHAAELLAHEIEWAFCDLERGVPSDEVRLVLHRLTMPTRPIIVGNVAYDEISYSGTSSRLQWGGMVSLGPLQRLPEEAPPPV